MMNRAAAVLIPLFSLRTGDDLGRGEILDLIPFVDFALAMGHRAVQLLPIGETAPGEASPYSALSVFAIDPLYISTRALTGIRRQERRAREAGGRVRAMPRDQIRAAKMPLLERAFRHFSKRGGKREREAFEHFMEEHQEWLSDYALFRALKDRFEWVDWQSWPEGLRTRDPAALAAARSELAEPIGMYCYWQFLAHRQWREVCDYAARRGAALGGDLSFSPARESAEVWANQQLFNLERTVGTPPDAFSAKGQRWGLPMPDWARMRAEGFGWWRMRIRHSRALFDLFRIDHVVGLYRTFSFGADPDEPGCLFPADEEAQREQGEAFMRMVVEEAGAPSVIAEDLGTVPPWVRASLTALGVPGFKVMRWEKKNWGTPEERFLSPREYPELSVATTGTHDTETLTVWWRECPQSERQQLVSALVLEGRLNPRRRFLDYDALDAILEALYAAPSRLAVTPIQDLFGWSARINLPATIGPHNWSWRLPLPLERLRESPAIRARIGRIRAIAERTGRFA